MKSWERLLAGDRRALARLTSLVERGDALAVEALGHLYSRTGKAHVVGVTGPPGAGKSTLLSALIGAFRRRERRVGVVAVDPTSPVSGGALLGDRVRMMAWHADDGVFIRSMASRGHVGGLARATAGVVHLLDAAGFDPVFVETVGVGQAEAQIARHAHTTVLVQVPGFGDEVQSLKAGVLELADVLVVNKADRDGADELIGLLTDAVRDGMRPVGAWEPPVLPTVATADVGIDAVVDAIDAHRASLLAGPGWTERVRDMARAEVSSYVRAEIDRRLDAGDANNPSLGTRIDDVARRRIPPLNAARELLNELGRSG